MYVNLFARISKKRSWQNLMKFSNLPPLKHPSPTSRLHCVQSTDHELIPTRSVSLAAMQRSASESNVRYYPTWKHSRPSKKEMNKAVTMLPNCPMFAVRLWITTSPYRWPIGSLPPTCIKDVYTPQGSTRDLWTVMLPLAVPWLRGLVAGLPPRRPGFASGSFIVGFVVDKVTVGQVFNRVLRFSLVSNITPPWLHTHIIIWGKNNRSTGGRSSETYSRPIDKRNVDLDSRIMKSRSFWDRF
jgi:hypothetical protein